MGYTTEFSSHFTVSPAMRPEHVAYLNKFAETRRMWRDVTVLATMPDPVRESVGLPLGEGVEYFVGGGGFAGQDEDASILNYNRPPPSQPGLWCKWAVVKDEYGNDVVAWNHGEKFYDYIEWLRYLINRFFKPWEYVLNGTIQWQGEKVGDSGTIEIVDNEIRVWR